MMRKKILCMSLLSIIMCASLIVGATMALFTSESKVNVAITSGKVKVVATIDEDIALFSMGIEQMDFFANGGTASVAGSSLTLDKMTPGDKAVVALNIQNDSNVATKYRVRLAGEGEAELLGQLLVGYSADNANYTYYSEFTTGWETLGAGTTKTYLSVELPSYVGGGAMGRACSLTVTLEAVQGNAAPTGEGTASLVYVVETQEELNTALGKVKDGETIVLYGDSWDSASIAFENAQTLTVRGEDLETLEIDMPEGAIIYLYNSIEKANILPAPGAGTSLSVLDGIGEDEFGYTILTHPHETALSGSGTQTIADGSYYLSGDYVGNLTVSGNVDLCLNGYRLLASNGSAITVTSGATLNLYDCNASGKEYGYTVDSVSGLWTVSADPAGAGSVIVGGVITGGAASNGGGINIDGGVLNMYGGTIAGNAATASGGGGGVYVGGSGGVFNLYGGAICGNTALVDSSAGPASGGAISMGAASNNEINLCGGQIAYNKATAGGALSHSQNGTVSVSGSVVIRDNTAVETGNNLYITAGKTIAVGELKEGAEIWVTAAEGVFTNGYQANNAESSPEDFFAHDSRYYLIEASEDQNEVQARIDTSATLIDGGIEYIPLTSDAIAADGVLAAGNYFLVSDYETTITIQIEGEVKLHLNGNSLSVSAANSRSQIHAIQVGSTGTLYLYDNDENSGSITHLLGFGRGVRVDGGIFYMYGGTISGNQSSSMHDGGGVYVNGGTFCLYGGTIAENGSSSKSGGGVYVASGKFNMEGGTISGNTGSGGGGVYVASNGTFEMKDGTISGNTSATSSGSSGGGGVYVAGVFTMSGGTISQNVRSGNNYVRGGGVFVNGGSFEMNGGTISENNVTSKQGGSATSWLAVGGGVFVNSGSFTMNAGSISGNRIDAGGTGDSYIETGSGVYVKAGATFEFVSGTVADNLAANNVSSEQIAENQTA